MRVAIVVGLLAALARPARADAIDDALAAPPPPVTAEGKAISLGGLAAVHAAAYTWAYFAWYRGRDVRDHVELDDEGWFGAETYAGGADKLGHGFATYAFTRGSIGILEVGGWSPTVAAGVSAGLTAAFFTLIELKDGVHEGYGFSIGDTVFNLGGIALGVAMAELPRLDRLFDFRLEYLPTSEFVDQVRMHGVNVTEDYSGMSFGLAFHLRALDGLQARPSTRWLRWFDVMAGYETRGYLPAPTDPDEAREQRLFLGVSLDLQGLLREYAWPDPIHRRELSFRRAGDWMTEMFTVPYTTLRLADLGRARPASP